MEARASGRTRGLMLVVVLSLLKPTAGGFAGSPLVTETYLSTDTEDSEQSSEFPTSSRAVISEGTARFGYSSTSKISDHPSFSERESHTATDQSSVNEVTESWTAPNRSDMSTELLDFSPAFSTNTVTEWEDPSTIANITDAYTVAEAWQPASEVRTVRDLTVTKLTEQEHTDQDTTESGSNTDSAYISTTLSRARERTLLSITSDSTSPYMEHTSSSSLETAPHTVTGQAEKTGISQDMVSTEDTLFTESGHTVAEAWQPASEVRTVRDLIVTKLIEQKHTDQDTTESGSNTDSTYISTTLSRAREHTLLSITSNSTSPYVEHTSSSSLETAPHTVTGQVEKTGISQDMASTEDMLFTESGHTVAEAWQPASEFRTVRDLTVTKLTEQEHTDQDTTESGSNTDSTYFSTTLSRAGDRTLLSITSNSTSPYVEHTSSSSLETAPHTVTGQAEKTGITQDTESTEDALFTESGHSEDFSVNATQKKVLETEVTHGTQITLSHTGQPTGSDFESMPKTSNPSSTPPLTLINSSDSETDTTADSSTNQTYYTDSSSSSSFIPPSVPPDVTHTNVSHQDSETTGPTGPVSTSTGEKPDEPKTSETPNEPMEKTTIPSLTTAPSTDWNMTNSVDESQSTQHAFVSQTYSLPEPTEVLSTAAGPSTHMPTPTEEDTHKPSTVPVTSTTLASTGTTAPLTTQQFQASTTAEAHSTPHSTLSATETTKKTMPTTEQHHPTTGTATPSLSASSSQSGAGSTDLSTLHFETSTATPGSTKAHSQHTTASYNKSTPAMSTAVITTGKRTETEATTSQMPVKISLTPGHMCRPQICANGGECVPTLGGYRCNCLPAWRGENCTEDVDECVSSPCPQDSVCVNTRGSFSCDCALGYDLQDGRSCTQTKTFLGIFSVNSSLHDSHREILQLLNASLSNLRGYRRSTLRYLDRLHILAVNMFSMSADVTSNDIFFRIQMSLRNCNKPQSHCSLKLQHQLAYQVESLCSAQKNRCDTQYAVCNDTEGTPYCQCHEGYFKKNPEDSTCRDCGDGFKLVNGTCMECAFGFGGFNCNNFYGLIAKVVSPAAGGLLLIVIIALIVTCCRKDKNDINKIIFKSGDLQMSPYGDFPKSSRVSMEWGRETIEMQENGSTKNLLQMTDIYYSPALRNADLERNGLYPFSGLPGSRHSCIYPAQWNPSFISDDSRRRDYF
ncbi:protein HEG [Ictalurus furcatus]|uniref:protein HEG n=1 Tax=Ictalurus furcatus TaxID=66913 RepID=UPI00235008AB|nr:protein HEG [Ictalurus furcatus]